MTLASLKLTANRGHDEDVAMLQRSLQQSPGDPPIPRHESRHKVLAHELLAAIA
jgi:hypothetical protein